MLRIARYRFFISGIMLSTMSLLSHAHNCPDPQTTSLKWGSIPTPWLLNPYSPNSVQGDDTTHFVRANILVAGYGQGIVCNYRNSSGQYSIWWPVLSKIPARTDASWINTLGGFVCTESIQQCPFFVAPI